MKRRSHKRLWLVIIDGTEYKQRTMRKADAIYGACLKHFDSSANHMDINHINVTLIEGTPYEEKQRSR